MSSLEKRLEAFRRLPLKAQLALIASTKANSVLAQNHEYIDGLERVHAKCVQESTPEQKASYQKVRDDLMF